jgi:arylsulfatase A-like enzyme
MTRWIPALRCLLVAIALSAWNAVGADTPNFLIIVVDDQGYADLSAFEHAAPDVQTPNMDRLAARGVLFTNAYATAGVCSPARAGWNSGQHQARWDPKSSFNCGLPKDVPHIASLLKANGYATAKIGKNDYGNQSLHRQDVYEYPLNHGFDEFLGFSAHGHDFFLLSDDIQERIPDPQGHSASVGPMMHDRGTKEFKEGYLTEIFTDTAIDYLDRHRVEPFYLTLSYNAVHHLIHQSPKRYLDKFGVKEIPNYDPDKDGSYAKWFKRFIALGEISDEEMRKYYLANLNCLDDNIGRVLDALDEFELTDNTVVVFFSDNGGPPTNGARNLPLAGSKFTLWEGGIRIPFIISRPGDPHAGEVWDQPISTLDVVPTCLDAAGIEFPDNLDGRPIAKSKESRNFFWRWNDSYAVRSGDWKLIRNGGRSPRKPTSGVVNRDEYIKGTRLFNLTEDPGESRDLAKRNPRVTQRLKKLYRDWSNEVAGENSRAN